VFLKPASAGAALCLSFAVVSTAFAQNSRSEELEQLRAAKSTGLYEYQPGRLEKALLYFEQRDPLGRIAPRNGFFVRYGLHEKPVGAGIWFTGGYRLDLFDRRARVAAEGGLTLRNYQLLRADFSLPYLAGGRFEVGVEATRRHNPQDDFFGLGPSSVETDRVSYRIDTTTLLARALYRPQPWVTTGVHAGRVSPSIGAGTDPRFPSLEERFDDVQAPGLATQPDFGYRDVFATVDYRDHPGNARAGGYYSLTVASYSDLDAERYGFRRVDLHAQHFFPIFDKKRVFALQGRVITSTAHGEDGVVPFYLQPILGGSTTLRSVSDYRFRDDNLFYLNAEYRWEAVGGLDMAIFTDVGKVAPDAGDLDFSSLKHAIGMGVRFNTYKSVFLRFDVAAGAGEGLQYYLKFSKAF
jgi:outer membrane protein assembly factor BamA